MTHFLIFFVLSAFFSFTGVQSSVLNTMGHFIIC